MSAGGQSGVRAAGRRAILLLVAAVLATACMVWLVDSSGDRAVAPLRHEACGPLRVVDREGRPLRDLPSACGHRGRKLWVRLSEIPPLMRDAVLISEDRRFTSHAGVDLVAVGRATVDNLLSLRVVSGASTITMQLMRMLHHPGEPRTVGSKLVEAWFALAAERKLNKDEILEGYFNHAYYGRGAYGVAEAASRYFDKTPAALTNAEAGFLAVLPRAPSAYDPSASTDLARERRRRVLSMLVEAGRLDPAELEEVESELLSVRRRRTLPPFEAPHFVDWVLSTIPDVERRAGGLLTTTLDLELQRRLERAVENNVASLAPQRIQDAGLVVLDTRSSEIRAMVGSTGYEASQINMATRRRHPGSLLKPFVYALAIEQGQSPSGLVHDVGDVPSAYRSRDWVGREGGPLPMAEALAGSYNLAAVHTLEKVGVGALHERLRRLGVAEASLAPETYGLDMALGSARVRLLDVTAGFGFLVRDGRVRPASGVRHLRRRGDTTFSPRDRGEVRGFSPQVSWLVMDMLSNPYRRHGRFGAGLPVEGGHSGRAGVRVVAKTGTASGMSDVTTVLATREFLVGAWAGRTDGTPSRGMSGMWGAAPLARLALDVALEGRTPTLPERPVGLVRREVCAVSGMPAQPACPERRLSYELEGGAPGEPCTWHRVGHDGVELRVPEELHGWVARARALEPRDRGR